MDEYELMEDYEESEVEKFLNSNELIEFEYEDYIFKIPVNEFEIESVTSDERGMGEEKIYLLTCDYIAPFLENTNKENINFDEYRATFELSEYPIGCKNFITNQEIIHK